MSLYGIKQISENRVWVCTPGVSNFFGKGSQLLLWAASQGASAKLQEMV